MKKIYILITAILFSAFLVNAQGVWTQKANFGGASRNRAVGFSIGTKGYIGTGANAASIYKDFWEYDPSTDVWTQMADYPPGGRYGCVGFSIGTKGYVGTGSSASVKQKEFYEYDPSTNVWTQKANFGGTARLRAVGFAIGAKGYIGTGDDGVTKQDFWEYNPATDTWTQKASYLMATANAAGFSIGTKGYIGTGNNGDVYFFEYNSVTNSWTSKTNIGGTGVTSASGFSLGSFGYIGLGSYSGTYKQEFWEYHPSFDGWVPIANLSGPGRWQGVAFSIGSKGYAGTGSGSSGALRDFYEWDPCAAMSTTITATPDTCKGKGKATVSATGGTTPYTYLWSSGGTTTSITGLVSGTYSVTILDSYGCAVSNSANVGNITNPVPICLVTVDTSTSTKNVIVWEKPVAGNIDSFRIYRNIASVLTHIASVSYDSLSMYTDTSSGINPKIQAYEYAISVIDTCGFESAKSSSHITIHQATPQFTPPATFDLSWTDYQGFAFPQYIILRDNNNNGSWVKIDSVPFSLPNQYTDIAGTHPAPTDSARYIVEAAPAQPCNVSIKNPDAFTSSIKSSKSNTSDRVMGTFVSEISPNNLISIYPNPNHGSFTVIASEAKQSQIKIYNTLGELVYQSSVNGKKTEIKIPKTAKGIYQMQIITDDETLNKKIIIE
ncbi:MAG: T9SS type A sorting domain-containing protein [Bacteroidetes bacterium]|nr:T9SS type A sorting domain-containing protein [Bacteroidota bacterium]